MVQVDGCAELARVVGASENHRAVQGLGLLGDHNGVCVRPVCINSLPYQCPTWQLLGDRLLGVLRGVVRFPSQGTEQQRRLEGFTARHSLAVHRDCLQAVHVVRLAVQTPIVCDPADPLRPIWVAVVGRIANDVIGILCPMEGKRGDKCVCVLVDHGRRIDPLVARAHRILIVDAQASKAAVGAGQVAEGGLLRSGPAERVDCADQLCSEGVLSNRPGQSLLPLLEGLLHLRGGSCGPRTCAAAAATDGDPVLEQASVVGCVRLLGACRRAGSTGRLRLRGCPCRCRRDDEGTGTSRRNAQEEA
mmetsp:Transcript_98797/g.247645  ORF Transcript_98797/g.247645 Transcript_98797/m.247645 type:complete len:304 (+) Transcript_98797:553-1464(+)